MKATIEPLWLRNVPATFTGWECVDWVRVPELHAPVELCGDAHWPYSSVDGVQRRESDPACRLLAWALETLKEGASATLEEGASAARAGGSAASKRPKGMAAHIQQRVEDYMAGRS